MKKSEHVPLQSDVYPGHFDEQRKLTACQCASVQKRLFNVIIGAVKIAHISKGDTW